jgi:Effector Associated Constant Component 1
VELSLTAGNETGDLWTWIKREGDLRGHVRCRPGPIPEGTLGPDIVIAAAVSAVAVLARSVCGYLAMRERSRGADLELTVTRKSGEVDRLVVSRAIDPVVLAELLVGRDQANKETEDDDGDASTAS